MMDFKNILQVIADSMFGGDLTIVGLLAYSVIILIVLGLTRKAFPTMIIALPVTFVFNLMGFINQDMMILLIIIVVLGLAWTSRNVWKD